MFFFCPLSAPDKPEPTTLERERAIAPDWRRDGRLGLVVDAESPEEASATATTYLLACHRSGRPGYYPLVYVREREGVPVVRLIGDAPTLTPADAAAIRRMIAAEKRGEDKARADGGASV